MSLGAGEVFAGYTVVRLLGSGGMGEVYLAKHPRLPRQDALKVLPASVSADADFRARFEREADLAATLWHPHVVGVHDRGEYDGRLWISMDYVDGSDAAALLREQYPEGMPPDEVADVVTAIADALDYAHERQLLHRDVKPANILLTSPPRRRILLADFGIARRSDDVNGLTATNMTVGSVAYTAPEQLMGDELDGRVDQYSLAATAYHLLTGTAPFAHSNQAVVISRHLSSAPPALAETRPDLAAADTAIGKALAKTPADRFDTCAEFASALRHALSDVPSASAEPTGNVVRPTEVVEAPTTVHETPPTFAYTPPPPAAPTVAAPLPSMPSIPPFSYGTYPPPPPPQGGSGRAIGIAVAAVLGVIGLIAVVALIASVAGGGDDDADDSLASRTRTPSSFEPAAPSGSTATTSYRASTPTSTVRARVQPPDVPGRDATGRACPGGFYLTDRPGQWGSAAVRGTDATTCLFVDNTLQAYWAAGGPAPFRSIDVAGAVDCRDVGGARCNGRLFVMECRDVGNGITCTGGRNAVVRLW